MSVMWPEAVDATPLPGAVSFTVEWPRGDIPPEGFCDIFWGSHGCRQPRGHSADLPHECDCCECGEHHPYPDWPDEGVLCVAKPPYYGSETRFYGDDVAAYGLLAVQL